MPEIRLKIFRSPTESRAETYRQTRVTVGREINNDVPVPERDVSRFHCILECDEEGWRVVDLESTNGTFLNGISVKKSALNAGDVVVVGATRLHVLECSASVAFMPVTVGEFRLIQSFDAREFVGTPRADKARRPSPTPEGLRHDGTAPSSGPHPSMPLIPVLTSEEILKGASDPTPMLRLIASRLLHLHGADACLIQACDPETLQVKWNVVEPFFEQVIVPADILAYVRERKTAVHVEPEDGAKALSLAGMMCAPIFDGPRFLGVIAMIRRQTAWHAGSFELEALSVSALAAGAALGCAWRYGQIERAHLALLESGGSLPATVADRQQGEAEGILFDSVLQRLRAELHSVLAELERWAGEVTQDETTGRSLAELLKATRRADAAAKQIAQLIDDQRDLAGTTGVVGLLHDLGALLREIAGPAMIFNERIPHELPAASVNPRVLRAALARIVLFCRDRVHAVRLTLTADTCELTEPYTPVAGFEPILEGSYVFIRIEGEGDASVMEELATLRDDSTDSPRDPRSRAMGLYWAASALRRSAAKLLVSAEGDRVARFEMYLPSVS